MLALGGELDLAGAATLEQELARVWTPAAVVVDLRGLDVHGLQRPARDRRRRAQRAQEPAAGLRSCRARHK